MAGEMRAILNAADVRGKKNLTGGTLLKGYCVKLSTVTDDLILLPAAITDANFGVLMADVLTGNWVDVQINGMAVGIAGTGGVVKGDRLTHDTAGYGRVVTAGPAAGVNQAIVGIANRTAAVGTPVEIELSRPGAVMQGA